MEHEFGPTHRGHLGLAGCPPPPPHTHFVRETEDHQPPTTNQSTQCGRYATQQGRSIGTGLQTPRQAMQNNEILMRRGAFL